MENKKYENFTKYEIARIIGARALQIAMDAPFLLKMPESDLKLMKYDSLKIAEKEFESGILPITIQRPIPKRRKDKLKTIKEEKVSDEEIVTKEQEVEKEIVEDAGELGLVNNEDTDADIETSAGEEQ